MSITSEVFFFTDGVFLLELMNIEDIQSIKYRLNLFYLNYPFYCQRLSVGINVYCVYPYIRTDVS